MNCPIDGQDTIVVSKDGPDRRRKCTVCGNKFTTTEVLKEEHERLTELVQDARELAEKITAGA